MDLSRKILPQAIEKKVMWIIALFNLAYSYQEQGRMRQAETFLSSEPFENGLEFMFQSKGKQDDSFTLNQQGQTFQTGIYIKSKRKT